MSQGLRLGGYLLGCAITLGFAGCSHISNEKRDDYFDACRIATERVRNQMLRPGPGSDPTAAKIFSKCYNELDKTAERDKALEREWREKYGVDKSVKKAKKNEHEKKHVEKSEKKTEYKSVKDKSVKEKVNW